jgi:prophage regulatory protein
MRKQSHPSRAVTSSAAKPHAALPFPDSHRLLPDHLSGWAQQPPSIEELVSRVRALTNERIIRLPEVLQITGRSRPAVWSDIGKGLFPRPLKLGAKSSGWLLSEIMGWVLARTIISRVDPHFDMKAFVDAMNRRSIA